MSYFSIAQKYAHGDFRHAINGYWSPLLSWLLVPAVWLHLNLIVAAKWLNALIAGVLLAIVYLYLVRRRVDRIVTYATCFILATILAVWVVYEVVTPDLLEALLLVMFAFCLTSFTRCPRQRLAYAIGIVGAGLYYAKGMGFYLALLVILTSAGWEWWSSNARSVRPVLRHYLPILIIFFGLTLPFIAIISVKYHRPTISNAGTFDWNVYGVHGQGIQPIDSIGPAAPPNATAVSAWEDPTFLSSQTPDWNPLQSRAALSYFGKLVWQNFTAIFSIMQGFGSYLSFAFVLLLIACVRRSTYQRDAIIFTGVTLISIAAYILIFIDARYLWGEAVLAVTITALFLSKLLDEKSIGRYR
jgi:4-amino-4-deoxy-L-arabinose transferase-like glycosyltransferase